MINLQTTNSTWYTSLMARGSSREKRTETISAKVPPSVKAKVTHIVELFDRTESYVGLALLERGLAAYERDGQIFEPSTDTSQAPVPQEHRTAPITADFETPEEVTPQIEQANLPIPGTRHDDDVRHPATVRPQPNPRADRLRDEHAPHKPKSRKVG